LKVDEAIRHFDLDPPRSFPKELSDQQLGVILRKGEIGPVDRDNHEVITGQFAEMHEAPLRIGIEMYLGKGVPNAWYTIEIPPEDVDALQ
jgi:hypothetical protein